MQRALSFDELDDFTFKTYARLLEHLNEIYKIVPLCQTPHKNTPYIILRHDIDISLPAALKMAKIEKDMGIKSTYFVWFSSRSYNILEGQNVSILRQISKLRHEIGLHYHISQYRSYSRSMKKTLKIEVRLLEHLLGKKVYSIARHGPSERDPFATTKEYINANHPRFRGDLFVHDSARAWTPLQGLFRLLNEPPRRAQLLTHPENWQEEKISREALLERFFRDSEKKNLVHKKQLRKIWQTDPQSKPERAYYDKLIRWYIINTTFGWNIRKLKEIVQSKFKQTSRS